MLCSKCKKNTAVLFADKMIDGRTQKVGLCIPCANEEGMNPMEKMLSQSGMSQKDFDNINQQMMDMFEDPEIGNTLNDFMNKMMGGEMVSHDENQEDAEFLEEDDENEEDDHKKARHQRFTILGGFMPNGEDEDFDFSEYEETQSHSKKTKTKKKPAKKKKNLEAFGINLTKKAKLGQVDRIIGRHREIDRVIQILNRRQKNNPILIGEPGVGKTAIAEGLAVRIEEGQVPVKLLNAEVYLLDLTALVAGTQFRGQFEGRMKAVLREARESENVILVIDEVHNISGAGEAESGAMNAANILKPALARGEIQIIGATTLEEYRKHIEKDTALERRFQPIIVDEPSPEEAVEIIIGIRDYYEQHHKVIIKDDIIKKAVEMSERYIHDRYLPDKAIDVIDEAGSRANLKNMGLVELEALRSQLDKIMQEKEEAANSDDYEKAAECKSEELRIQDKIDKLEKESGTIFITEEDIAYVIEAWTKIPVQSISEDEAMKLMHLEERLEKRVKGQNEAIKVLAKAIRRNRSGFKTKRKPSSFVFVGPTGVGKTELAKTLADELFGSEEALIRFDMSEFMEKHSVSKLIGAPPGYVGYDQAGQLTERIRRRPYSVILLDEIEKAHGDVFNLLLQIFEDGRLTDSQGRTVNFENTVIIMTSNVGTSTKASTIGYNNDSKVAKNDHIMNELKKLFRPEFVNRIDEIMVFNKLDKAILYDIVKVMLKDVKAMAKEKNIELHIEQEVEDYLVEIGYDEAYGARPLRRAITKEMEDEISEEYIKGVVKDGDKVHVYMEEKEVKLEVEK